MQLNALVPLIILLMKCMQAKSGKQHMLGIYNSIYSVHLPLSLSFISVKTFIVSLVIAVGLLFLFM